MLFKLQCISKRTIHIEVNLVFSESGDRLSQHMVYLIFLMYKISTSFRPSASVYENKTTYRFTVLHCFCTSSFLYPSFRQRSRQTTFTSVLLSTSILNDSEAFHSDIHTVLQTGSNPLHLSTFNAGEHKEVLESQWVKFKAWPCHCLTVWYYSPSGQLLHQKIISLDSLSYWNIQWDSMHKVHVKNNSVHLFCYYCYS